MRIKILIGVPIVILIIGIIILLVDSKANSVFRTRSNSEMPVNQITLNETEQTLLEDGVRYFNACIDTADISSGYFNSKLDFCVRWSIYMLERESDD